MATVNFPNSPSNGQTLTTNTGITYTYNSSKARWDATTGYVTASALDNYLQVANASSGSTVTTYSSNTVFPSSGNANGALAFSNSTGDLFVWDGSQWDKIAHGVDESPVIITEPPSSAILYSNGSITTVTMVATDPEGFDIIYGIAYNNLGSVLPVQLASSPTISSNGVYTFTPSSNTSHAGSFKARLSASDGAKITTRFTNISLTFSQDVIFTSAEPGVSSTLTNTTTGWSRSGTTPSGNMAQSNTLQTGKRYFEMYITADTAIPLVGIYPESNTDPGHNDTDGPAISLTTGNVAPTGTFVVSGLDPDASYPATLMIAFDTTARKVWFGLNGSWGSGSGDPTSGTGYDVGGTGGFTLCLGNGTSTGTCTLTSNILLDTNLTYSIPTGFQSQ
jgi:hypothetical protein